MKPLLDRMIDMIVAGLSGKAKAFYELEFGFFEEVTSISGKLKPYIKKTKPEKKVSTLSGLNKAATDVIRPRSTRKWQRSSWKSGCIFLVIRMVKLSIWIESRVGHYRVTQR
jgi:hypothetical protein